MRILVVEDERRIADFLGRGLQGAGYAIDLAPDGATAIQFTHDTDYDLVILDTPPVIPVADALVLSRHADATLLVVRWEKTSRVAVQDAVGLLRRSRAVIMASVLTRADIRRAAQSGGRPAKLYDYASDYRIMRS